MPEQITVFVGVGSNIRPEVNVAHGIELLTARFGRVRRSPTYRCEAVGFEGDAFHNLVVQFETDLPALALVSALREIEARCGRDRTGSSRSRTLDLDLLLYGDQQIEMPGLSIPRGEILEYAFVLRPLAELAGDRRHPVLGETFDGLWRSFASDSLRLEPIAGEDAREAAADRASGSSADRG